MQIKYVLQEYFTPPRPESTMEEHMLAQRARYQAQRGELRDATDSGR